MSLHRRAARRDANERDIVIVLRAFGATVTAISGEGAPDLLVKYRGILQGFEVKSEKGRRTAAQEVSQWPILRSVDDAIAWCRKVDDGRISWNPAG